MQESCPSLAPLHMSTHPCLPPGAPVLFSQPEQLLPGLRGDVHARRAVPQHNLVQRQVVWQRVRRRVALRV